MLKNYTKNDVKNIFAKNRDFSTEIGGLIICVFL